VPQLVKGIIALEPEGPPFVDRVIATGPNRAWGLTSIPITYEPSVIDPKADIKTVEVPSGRPDVANVSYLFYPFISFAATRGRLGR